jgi:hypothetical protein
MDFTSLCNRVVFVRCRFYVSLSASTFCASRSRGVVCIVYSANHITTLPIPHSSLPWGRSQGSRLHRPSTSSYTSTVLTLDGDYTRWDPLPQMHGAREAFACAAIGGCVIVAGGDGFDTAEVYEEALGRWRRLPCNLPHGNELWFMVYGLWFMVYGLWFMVYGQRG